LNICGMDIQGKITTIVVIRGTQEDYEVLKTTCKLELLNPDSQEDIRNYYMTLCSFIKENKIDVVYLRRRGKKGGFSGGADSFKIEALIQLLDVTVQLISPVSISSIMKKTPAKYLETVFNYQQEALKTAVTGMQKNAKRPH
jgi:hypothetical protein